MELNVHRPPPPDLRKESVRPVAFSGSRAQSIRPHVPNRSESQCGNMPTRLRLLLLAK
jgi:hypothetical protein